MNRSFEELVSLCYRFYPRGMWDYDPAYKNTAEHRRLIAARLEAWARIEERWRPLLRLLAERIPESHPEDRSMYLSSGGYDACYCARIVLPPAGSSGGRRVLEFCVSILAPYYVILAQRWSGAKEQTASEPDASIEADDESGGDTFVMTPEMELASTAEEDDERYEQSFELNAEEEAYAHAIEAEIEAAFPGYEPLPPEVGNRIVPEAMAGSAIGETKLYHCLFQTTL